VYKLPFNGNKNKSITKYFNTIMMRKFRFIYKILIGFFAIASLQSSVFSKGCDYSFKLLVQKSFDESERPDGCSKYIPAEARKYLDCGLQEYIEFFDLPYFEQADWYEANDIWYGPHKTSWVSFSDGIRGKIFIGGYSGKYFIGDSDGGKYYYVNQKSVIRALYMYKKYGCISDKYRD